MLVWWDCEQASCFGNVRGRCGPAGNDAGMWVQSGGTGEWRRRMAVEVLTVFLFLGNLITGSSRCLSSHLNIVIPHSLGLFAGVPCNFLPNETCVFDVIWTFENISLFLFVWCCSQTPGKDQHVWCTPRRASAALYPLSKSCSQHSFFVCKYRVDLCGPASGQEELCVTQKKKSFFFSPFKAKETLCSVTAQWPFPWRRFRWVMCFPDNIPASVCRGKLNQSCLHFDPFDSLKIKSNDFFELEHIRHQLFRKLSSLYGHIHH